MFFRYKYAAFRHFLLDPFARTSFSNLRRLLQLLFKKKTYHRNFPNMIRIPSFEIFPLGFFVLNFMKEQFWEICSNFAFKFDAQAPDMFQGKQCRIYYTGPIHVNLFQNRVSRLCPSLFKTLYILAYFHRQIIIKLE